MSRSSWLRRFACLLSALWSCRAVGGALPGAGDPARLIDLRWLARPCDGSATVIDTLSGRDAAGEVVGEWVTAASLEGPGAVTHLMCGRVGRLRVEIDGAAVYEGAPQREWASVYPPPESNARGELPFAFPLVQVAGPYAHALLPLPFSAKLTVSSTEKRPEVWLYAQRLSSSPAVPFSTDGGSVYMRTLSRAYALHGTSPEELADWEQCARHRDTICCPAKGVAALVDLSGPREVVGLRLRMQPGALDLLRHQVIALEIDGVRSVEMPLVDYLGVSHPWPHAWFAMAGDWAAGVVHPYSRSGGRVQAAVTCYSRLPVPFEKGLRIEIRNRSTSLPVVFDVEFRTVPLASDGPRSLRLCGASRALKLPSEGECELASLPGPGRLAGLSLFTTGHRRGVGWARSAAVGLQTGAGEPLSGVGLLPLGMQGRTGNIVFGSHMWNHNSLEQSGRSGAGRHFWRDPPLLSREATLVYGATDATGPTRGELGVVWYQARDAEPFVAARTSDTVEELPPVFHGQARRPLPGGWWREAEDFAGSAEPTTGPVRTGTTGTLDSFASGGAFLAWNAERRGDCLDLPVPLPASRYVRLWYHRLLFPSGGVFGIEVVAADEPAGDVRQAMGDADFRARVLGMSRAVASIDCYDVWPHRQAYRFDMPPVLNPAPGGFGRVRFRCTSKAGGSRGYLLAVDQLGLDPPPAAPGGWRQMEDAAAAVPVQADRVGRMPVGRTDFQGWGGLEAVGGRGLVSVRLVQSVAMAAACAVEVRGIPVSGSWTGAVGEGAETELAAPPDGKGPCLWRLPVSDTSVGPRAQTLRLRCGDAKGRLLLDAWRPLTGARR